MNLKVKSVLRVKMKEKKGVIAVFKNRSNKIEYHNAERKILGANQPSVMFCERLK